MSDGARVLLAKIGLDGHDRGVRVIARMLRDAGHEVIYVGRRQSPEAVAQVAVDEDVDVIGVSILAGTHMKIASQLVAAARSAGTDASIVIGGTVLRREIPDLLAVGVDAVFPVGTKLEEIQRYFDEIARSSRSHAR